MRNKELIKWIKLWKLKSQILPNCLYRKYGTQLGEFTNTSFVVLGAERVKSPKNTLPGFLSQNDLARWLFCISTLLFCKKSRSKILILQR